MDLGHVAESLLEEVEDVLVVQRVIDAASLTPPAHDSHRPHQAQLVRHRGLADADCVRQLVDAELTLGERVHDPQPRGIAEDAERIRQRVNGGGVFGVDRSD
jgi:hypothetical protein